MSGKVGIQHSSATSKDGKFSVPAVEIMVILESKNHRQMPFYEKNSANGNQIQHLLSGQWQSEMDQKLLPQLKSSVLANHYIMISPDYNTTLLERDSHDFMLEQGKYLPK